MVNLLTRVAEAGGEAVLLTADGGRPSVPNPGIQRVDLVERERRLPVNRVAGCRRPGSRADWSAAGATARPGPGDT